MNRRRFLGFAAAGAAVVAVPTAALTVGGFRQAAADILARELPFLTLDAGGVDRFINEYFADADTERRMRVRMLALVGRSADESWLVGDMVRTFLMGSDFFPTGMHEDRVVNYIGRYSAHGRPCQHPFSAAYYPDDSVPGG